MSRKSTKEKRRKIPTFTLKELEEAGKIPPYTNLMDPFDRWLLEKELEEAEQAEKSERNGVSELVQTRMSHADNQPRRVSGEA